ncbi:MAG: LamG domain-containing protein, partial [Bacteroidota bacterium]
FDFGSHIGKNWWLHTLPASDGKGVRFGMANGSGGTTELEYVFPEATADNWHNVAVSYNGSSVLLYVDGELIETAVTGHAAAVSPLFLGQKSDATGFYTGGIDELRFYNRQLAQTEIQMFMNRTVAPNAAGLVNYWKFDEGVGSKSFDLTASKQKLYFCGASWSSDKPNVVNAGLTDETGFYAIPGINYGAGTTFIATPSKKFYFNQSLEFNSVNNQYAELTDFDLADSSTVEVTVKAFDFSGNQCILTKQNGGTTHFGLHLNAGHVVLEMG